ncbi:putative nuclease HARBI1 [Ochlerotatus camptorhynchus]|uniref:putative nuclease HARBI1 n=1 Tax=Ochlerotatus camptorhynchus TaxID=644619 RepID=UPI0031DB82C8
MSSFAFWLDDDDIYEEDASVVRLERRMIRDPVHIEHFNFFFCWFVRYFRVSKDLFCHLLNIIEVQLGATIGSTTVLPVIKLAATIRFLAEGSYQKGVRNDLFVGIAQPTISKALTQVIGIMETYVCPDAIKFPTEEAEKNAIKLGFYQKSGFPGVIGCVDGTHIKIFPPPSDIQHLYYNRKGYHSLNALIVCDHQLMIRYVDANYPGSSHDSFIWNASPLNEHLKTNYQRMERNTWLLGRITVERSIGVLKNVFRCVLGARQLPSPKLVYVFRICDRASFPVTTSEVRLPTIQLPN